VYRRSYRSSGLYFTFVTKALPTLETTVADFGDNLSPNSATVAIFRDSRRRRFWRQWQSPFLATVAESPNSATIVASVDRLFGDSRRLWRQSPNSATVAGFGDRRRIWRQSLVLATVAGFGDYSRQCGQAITVSSFWKLINIWCSFHKKRYGLLFTVWAILLY